MQTAAHGPAGVGFGRVARDHAALQLGGAASGGTVARGAIAGQAEEAHIEPDYLAEAIQDRRLDRRL